MSIYIRFILWLFFGLSLTSSMCGQVDYPAEKTVLWTGRSIYISGENILFSGIVSSKDQKNILSEVVYVELITPDGKKINQLKFKLSENRFEGQMNIPQDILSGYYFIRAYTKWMRNGKPEDYAYVMLKLINPFISDLLQTDDSLINYSDSLQHKTKINSTDVFLDKETYQPGGKITVVLNTNPFKMGCLSIIPSVAEPFAIINLQSEAPQFSQILFYPETRGITLSGKVISRNNKTPIPFHRISARFADEKDFITVQSDTSGRFYMALPDRSQNEELFLIADALYNGEVELLIDQDYCSKGIAISVPPFSITSKEKDQVLQMAQISQLKLIYKENKSEIMVVKDSIAFYGKPIRAIIIEDYIHLDSLEMYFTDLPNAVAIKRQKGVRYFSFTGKPEFQLYDPLVLVDWLPIDEAERVLAINPSRIKKIDLIDELYLHGGIYYGGVISIITHKSDFGGFRFPESGMYLNYDFFDYSQLIDSQIEEEYVPFMNTYGWIPKLQSDSIQQESEFIAPQTKGDYLLILQGEDYKGEDLMISKKFKVE